MRLLHTDTSQLQYDIENILNHGTTDLRDSVAPLSAGSAMAILKKMRAVSPRGRFLLTLSPSSILNCESSALQSSLSVLPAKYALNSVHAQRNVYHLAC